MVSGAACGGVWRGRDAVWRGECDDATLCGECATVLACTGVAGAEGGCMWFA